MIETLIVNLFAGPGAGRNQTEDEAKEIDVKVRAMLDKLGKHYVSVEGILEGYDWIVEDVLIHLNKLTLN